MKKPHAMKKITLFLLMVLALGIMSCDRSTKTNTNAAMVLIENGKMLFYDLQKQAATPYEAEPDSVINFLIDDDHHLYYTASKDQHLTLKKLDLNEKDPQPVVCTDWQLDIDDIRDYMMGDFSNIELSADQKQVRIRHYANKEDEYLSEMRYCDLATGKLGEISFDDYNREYTNKDLLFGERFLTENHIFYRILPDGSKVALNDKINFHNYFEEEGEVEDLEFVANRVDPTGQKVIYEAVVYWGEGWGCYCMANMDGSAQQVLEGSSIWNQVPEWLEDGSLVYVGREPRDKNDPLYEEWNTTKPCVKRIAPDGSVTTIAHGDDFLVMPFGSKPEPLVRLKDTEGCDLAILDQGKVTFYNSLTNQFIAFETEKDSVVNADFMAEDDFYYTVAIGDELYLKKYFFSDIYLGGEYLCDWNLKLDECISQTYGKMAPLMCNKYLFRVGLPFDFSWDMYYFSNTRFFDPTERTKWDGWKEDDETDSFDEDFLRWDEDMSNFETIDNNYYYTDNGSTVCLSDKIDFKTYVSDPSYYEDPSFGLLDIDPTRKSVCYTAIIEYGDLGHGPLCFASLDGKIQLAFEDTDAATLTYGWLKDGSLVYLSQGSNDKSNIMRVMPDGKVSVLSEASTFVTLH